MNKNKVLSLSCEVSQCQSFMIATTMNVLFARKIVENHDPSNAINASVYNTVY